ncbi:class I adenylate-forming enzyme family protein [Pseudohalocynthiibacter aestuariivivens]|uniref:Class I adenylate-forming enzyme family protein n=1 Tax=Pseudohalocynthiibacter aestuariivivens TaxID=1591409 RepID=A0ABV5JC19_9RHOB|nr:MULTISPECIES: AMP-binding protein [Pseudohalocynthiibacter]MBS9716010.1 AMP-binding protein [Pseudohalocynthiibacter aestuariivivens]MCK0102433.1 AMP-binding protein [Pseudohalocynthiibacter sp. F2068]
MNLANWLIRTANLHPDRPALIKGTTACANYEEFARRAAAIGGYLKNELGVGTGDRVAVFMPNSTEYLEVLYGIWFAGAAAVPINAKLHEKEATWIIGNSGAVAVFTSDKYRAALAETPIDSAVPLISVDRDEYASLYETEPLSSPVTIGQDDLVWLFYTSGTTGKPKGVMISSANIQAMTMSYFVDVDEVSVSDAALYAAPMSHGAGLYNFMHVIRAARHVVPESGAFDADEILGITPQLDNVSMFAAPTMVRRLVERAKALGSRGEGIKTIVYGGGPMYLADIIDAVEAMGPRFVQILGQGECPMCITALSRDLVADRKHPNWRKRLSSVGVEQSMVTVRICGADGQELPTGEIGEICVAGVPVMLGYWQNEKATSETIIDGWLRTGDMGAMDQDGFVTLHDRSKDVVISGGSNIYPREVEEALLLHPNVSEVSVVGKPDPEWGEIVAAFVVSDGVDSAVLDAFCLDQIARFKRPKLYKFVSELPKNNYGKVLKTELRAQLESEG